MAEHWCKEHKQPFFKRGKMKNFAHPITGDDGEPTGEWCNEPKATTPPSEDEMTKEDWAERDQNTRKSIERQKALDIAGNVAVAKIQAGEQFTAFKILTIAKIFESYIENGVVVKDKE